MKPARTSVSGLAFIAAVFTTSTTAAIAASDEISNAKAERDFPQRIYIGGSFGISKLKPRTDATGFHTDDNSDTGGTLTGGFDLSKHLSLEAFFSRQGGAGIASDDSGNHVGEIDYDYHGFSGIGYFYNSRSSVDYPGFPDDEGYYRREGLSLYGRLGIGRLDTRSDNVVHRQRNDWDLHLGAGVEYGWSNGVAVRAEFTSYDKDDKMLSIGIIKRFGHASALLPAPKVVAPVAPPPVVSTPPSIKAPEPPKPMETAFEWPVIHFAFDSAELTPDAQESLEMVAEKIKKEPALKLRIDGHTDSKGSDRYNLRLGQRRAESAARFLLNHEIERDRLSTTSFGERKPIADNSTAEGRRLNRRVEFEVWQ